MNCSEFQNISHELARDHVEGREKVEALAHAGECPRCAEYLEEERRLSLKLGFLSQVMHGQEAPAQLEPVLMAAFREHAAQARENGGVPPHAGPRYWARQRFWVWGAGAAALAALLALVVGLQTTRRTPSPAAAVVAPSTISSPVESAPVTSALQKPNEVASSTHAAHNIKHNPVLVSRARPPQDHSAVAADASGFVPLIYCDELNCGTPADVVRVELPASSLPIMGLVSDNRTGTVRADVVVGEDGIARAIRLVDY